MSMFVCSPLHTVAVALIHHNPGIVSTAQIIETARILRTVNNAAAAARYGDKPVILSAAVIRQTIPAAVEWVRAASPADINQLVSCFNYQCAEDIPADYPGLSMLQELETRVHTGSGKSAVWSI